MVNRKANPAIKLNAREVAARVMHEVLSEGAYANIALDRNLRQAGLTGPDRGLATELAYGTLKHLITIDWILEQFLTGGLASLKPGLLNIIRLGVYQLRFLDRIPAAAACNEAVEMTRRRGLNGLTGLVNGVLRNVARRLSELPYPDREQDPVGYYSIVYSHPRWLVERWLNRLGPAATEALLQANNKPAPLSIRCNTLKTDLTQLKTILAEDRVTVEESRLVPEGLRLSALETGVANLKAHQQGYFFVQDESSMLVSYALSPKPDSLVIDACSAPGGKTTHLAQMMADRGRILAFDIHDHKLRLVTDSCRRLGISIVETVMGDARDLAREWTGQADYVLVDAPCSGLGVLRRKPDARWNKQPLQIAGLRELQLNILQAAARCVRSGGVLVYSTCTIEPEENLEVVEEFLAGQPEFVPEDLTGYLPFKPEGEDLAAAQAGYLQLYPHRHDMDGLFMARLRHREL